MNKLGRLATVLGSLSEDCRKVGRHGLAREIEELIEHEEQRVLSIAKLQNDDGFHGTRIVFQDMQDAPLKQLRNAANRYTAKGAKMRLIGMTRSHLN